MKQRAECRKLSTGGDYVDRLVRGFSSILDTVVGWYCPKPQKGWKEEWDEQPEELKKEIKETLERKLDEFKKEKNERREILREMSGEQLIMAVLSVWLHNTKADMGKWHGAMAEELDSRIYSANVPHHLPRKAGGFDADGKGAA